MTDVIEKKMRVLIISDLHLDYNSQKHGDLYAGLENLTDRFAEVLVEYSDQYDFAVIAGDISSVPKLVLFVLRRLGTKLPKEVRKKVKYVPGNHDLWVEPGYNSLVGYNDICDHAFTINNNPVEFGDWVIIGETGWYDLTKVPNVNFEPARWNKNPYPMMMDKLEEKLKKYQDKKILMVTHYVPFWECCHPKYAGNPANQYFIVSDIGELAKKYNVKHMIYGHTHIRQDLVVDGIQTYCRPLGYYHEWKHWTFEEEVKNTMRIVEF